VRKRRKRNGKRHNRQTRQRLAGYNEDSSRPTALLNGRDDWLVVVIWIWMEKRLTGSGDERSVSKARQLTNQQSVYRRVIGETNANDVLWNQFAGEVPEPPLSREVRVVIKADRLVRHCRARSPPAGMLAWLPSAAHVLDCLLKSGRGLRPNGRSFRRSARMRMTAQRVCFLSAKRRAY